jgi:hypothetical protein
MLTGNSGVVEYAPLSELGKIWFGDKGNKFLDTELRLATIDGLSRAKIGKLFNNQNR